MSASQPTPPLAQDIPKIPDLELIERIGSGGYGEVWLARSALGTLRAVRIVRRAEFDDDRPYERELAGIRKFEPISRSHEGFVDLLQVGRNDAEGWFYYVMELADDLVAAEVTRLTSTSERTPGHERSEPHVGCYHPRTLAAEVKLRGALPLDECLRIALSLTRALAELHRHGLVHRDIKPSNIIFVGGVPKLADIGLVASANEARSFVGTEGYIPPEGPGTAQADLYSLGIVLYVISTGKNHRDFPEPPADLGTRPDRERWLELQAIIHRASQTDPRERYTSAEAMLADLRLLAEGRSVRHRQTWQERKRIAAKLSLIATAAAATLWLLFPRLHDSIIQRSNASIFVLPFRNDGTNQVDEILRSRITDALIDGLAQIEGVKVGPRRIGLQDRSQEEARRQALKEFDARHTLAGTVRKSGDQVSIAIGFQESAQNLLLWSESFGGALTNLALTELRIVRRIAASLGTPLRSALEQEVSAKLSRNQSAYELYQRAFRILEMHGSEHLARSQMIDYLNRALDADANFAQAYTALALVHRIAAYYDRSPSEAMTEMRKNAQKAIDIDNTIADAYYWLGGVKLLYDYDWPGADAIHRHAFELDPSGHNGKAWYFRCLGRIDAARAEQEKAMQESPPWGREPGETMVQFLVDRKYDMVIDICQDMARKDVHTSEWSLFLGKCFHWMGRYEEALAELEKVELRWNAPVLLAEIGMVYARMGSRADALATLQQMDEQVANRYVAPYFRAQVYAALGDSERALDNLDKAYEDRCEHLVNADSWGLRTDPVWKDLESHPRFQALLKKVGLDVWPK